MALFYGRYCVSRGVNSSVHANSYLLSHYLGGFSHPFCVISSIYIFTQSVQADLTIVADGCFSKFRKDFISSSVTVSSYFAGTIMHNCPQHKSGYAEIILTSFGPVLVYQISSTATRILVDIQGKWPSDICMFMKEEIAPQLTGNYYLRHNYFVSVLCLFY